MKVIFLDIDGVLTTWASLSKGSSNLDPACLQRFLFLQDQTQAKVVLSSSWRVLPRLVAVLKQAGIRIQGQTPPTRANGMPRGHEISSWIESQEQPPSDYIILDDESDAGVGHDGHLVWTHPRDGLTQDKLEEALVRMVNPSPQEIDFGNPYRMVIGEDQIPSGWVVVQSFYGNGQPATPVGFPDHVSAQRYLDRTPGDDKTLLSIKQ